MTARQIRRIVQLGWGESTVEEFELMAVLFPSAWYLMVYSCTEGGDA